MTTMRRSTVRLLAAFRRAGGRVVFGGTPAGYVEARASEAVRKLAAGCETLPTDGAAWVRALESDCRRVSIRDGRGRPVASALYQLREDRAAYYLFVCNTGHSPAQLAGTDPMNDVRVCERRAGYSDVRIRVGGGIQGRPEEWSAETGRRALARAERGTDGTWEIRTDLPRLGARLFVLPKRPARHRLPIRPIYRDLAVRTLGIPRWGVALSEDNVLALDRPAFRMSGGGWRTAPDILRVDQAIRAAMGIPARGGHMVQPWAQVPEKHPRTARVELRYRVEVGTAPTGRLDLAMEQPAGARVTVNGVPVEPTADAGWWTDPSLRRLPVSAAVIRPGRNEIRMELDYTARTDLEIVYLLGDFGVKWRQGEPVLDEPVRALKTGDWVGQGLPFYGGHVGYRARCRFPRPAPGRRILLRFPRLAGAGVRVRVNGEEAGLALWPPYEVDVTPWCRGREGELMIEVLGHRRNSHGPLHVRPRWPFWTGPGTFLAGGADWSERYSLVPCGLIQAPQWVEQAIE